MPLSEQEQRLLEEMERSLYHNDADFVATVSSRTGKTNYRSLILGILVGILGVAVLIGGDPPTGGRRNRVRGDVRRCAGCRRAAALIGSRRGRCGVGARPCTCPQQQSVHGSTQRALGKAPRKQGLTFATTQHNRPSRAGFFVPCMSRDRWPGKFFLVLVEGYVINHA